MNCIHEQLFGTYGGVYQFLFFFTFFTVLRHPTTKFVSTLFTKIFAIQNPRHQTKVGETFWFFMYYSSAWAFSSFALWGKPYVTNSDAMFADYPTTIAPANLAFLMFELGFYASSFAYLFFETRKNHSDFWMMFSHHIASMFLIGVGVYFHYDKMAVVSLWIHDVADIFLEGAKVLSYCRFKTLRYIPFGILVFAWGVPRIYYFPKHVILSSFRIFMTRAAEFPMITFFLGFMSLLWVLDCVWWAMILKMVIKGLATMNLEKDVRSSSDSEAEATPAPAKQQPAKRE
ncbi:putative Acyl-CoA-dependent ceramide synthase [Paratrimastix pyriformis]|uniref:Acyl-CoA-dependent ceramide synthase n=1 Tax=Paratrimastix pyriformis TaxID=342808 RepID=A0ABQ8UQK9_9EUKA|nr:putative Acyl-CoA-dependent ceramide synthase [Paratrimastix pyriformis]